MTCPALSWTALAPAETGTMGPVHIALRFAFDRKRQSFRWNSDSVFRSRADLQKLDAPEEHPGRGGSSVTALSGSVPFRCDLRRSPSSEEGLLRSAAAAAALRRDADTSASGRRVKNFLVFFIRRLLTQRTAAEAHLDPSKQHSA